MRTRQQEQQRFNGLTPRQFGERIGLSEDAVRGLIRDGWFAWTTEEGAREATPECTDNRCVGGQRPEYRIKPSAVRRWFKERAATGEAA